MSDAGSITASHLSETLSKEPNWLSGRADAKDIIDGCIIDGEIQSLDASIRIKNTGNNVLALRLLDRIRQKYPDGDIGYYESGVNAAMLLDFKGAIDFAKKSISLNPDKIDHRSLLCRLYAITNQPAKAKETIGHFDVLYQGHRDYISQLAQFIDYCEDFSMDYARRELNSLKDVGAYLDAKGVSNKIMRAISEGQPFSFVRLGDGEGAWLRIDNYDEGKFAALYRANRISFLNDWFGSDHLIDDDYFNAFCRSLTDGFMVHDMIGVPPSARIDQEESFLSIRGIPSSVNVFRFLKSRGRSTKQALCSNSINLTLAHDTNFYRELFSCGRTFSVISSQNSMRDRFQSAGVNIGSFHIVPGDSRNFHLDAASRPLCQFPDYLYNIDEKLKHENLNGVVYLVAAGFVGKQYIKTIRERGGTALDIGSLADHWARNGLF